MQATTQKRLVILGVLVAAALVATSVQADPGATPSAGILDEIMNRFSTGALKWEARAREVANSFFFYGSIISLAWTGIRVALGGKDFEGFVGTIAKQILTLGFFYMLIDKGPWIAGLIITSFSQAGSEISGLAGKVSPSYICVLGFDAFFHILDAIGDMGLTDKATLGLLLGFCGLIILLSFAAIAILFLLTVIESYFVMYAGLIMLGFGALPWTRDIPKNYLVYAINVGVRLFVLYLVLGIGLDLAGEWPQQITSGDPSQDVLHNSAYIAVGALVFLAVAWKVPGIASALTSGAVNMSASDGIGAAAAAVGGAAGITGVAAAAATGGASLVGGASRGAVQAGMAGIGLAKEQGASGAAAAVKGVGHAIGAMASEASHAASSRMGFKPKSANSVDSHGRDINNLGTRAANNLAGKAQDAREANAAGGGAAASSAGTGKGSPGASTPASGGGAAAAASSGSGLKPAANGMPSMFGPGGSTPLNVPPPTNNGGSAMPGANGLPKFMAPPASTAAPSSGSSSPAQTTAPSAAPPAPLGGPHSAPNDNDTGTSFGEALRRAAPPPMPADGGGAGVQINLHSGHED